MSPGFRLSLLLASSLVVLGVAPATAAPASAADTRLAEYFRSETARLAAITAKAPSSLAEWQDRRDEYRTQLQDMLGLRPWPERSELKPVVTGTLEQHPEVLVEKIHFQSLPGLYVTANLYRPRQQSGPLPAVLYVCGHARVFTNGVSCGNKAYYQHHGLWFAQHGYVALLIDTLQLGEIEGFHHGTSRLNQWWWNSRGYTPAGVEAWNSIRAVDYLVSRPEVDPRRLAITGRSGGGSYSWTSAALDDRLQVIAPAAGITDLENHVVDGVIEGHCDCMYFVNTHRWDFGRNAQLLAPRPLLIVNTDTDNIFPLDGVQRIHAQTRDIYRLYGASTNLGLVIGPGEHKDTQDIQVPVFRWLNQHLKDTDPLITNAATRFFSPLDLRVFASLPPDQRNTTAAEWFGPRTPATLPSSDPESLLQQLHSRSFAGWPESPPNPPLTHEVERREGSLRLSVWNLESQPNVRLGLSTAQRGRRHPNRVVLQVLDDTNWVAPTEAFSAPKLQALTEELPDRSVAAWFAPRGIGADAWSGDARKQIQIRRRFMLLGQTVDGMRVWDILQALRALQELYPNVRDFEIRAERSMAVNALFAALYSTAKPALHLKSLPPSLREGPDYLNVLQIADLPDILRIAEQRGLRVVRE